METSANERDLTCRKNQVADSENTGGASRKPLLLSVSALIFSIVLPATALLYQSLGFILTGVPPEIIVVTLHSIYMVSPMAGLALAIISISQGKKQIGWRGMTASAVSLLMALYFSFRFGFYSYFG